MPDLSVSEAQLERLEEISEELAAVYVGEYGTVRPTDAFQYLLDTYTPPDPDPDAAVGADAEVDAEGDPASTDGPDADTDALTEIDGVGEATADALAEAGFPTVDSVADADPDAVAELRGIGREQAVDIVASAAAIDAEDGPAADADAGAGSPDGTDGASEPPNGGDPRSGSEPSPENTLQQAMSLLEAHDDRWREASGDEPYEVDLPDGSTEAVRTKDDIKRLLFKHWR
jgi:hypothetical protein